MQQLDMTEPSQEIMELAIALERAIVAQLTGNSFYLAAQHANELRELLERGNVEPRGNTHKGTMDSEADFATILGKLRKKAEDELTDNRHYMVLHKLDVLAFLAQSQDHAREEQAPLQMEVKQPPAAALSQVPEAKVEDRTPVLTFDEVAAFAKAHVGEAAAQLNMAGQSQPIAVLDQDPQPIIIASEDNRDADLSPAASVFSLACPPQSMEEVAAIGVSAEGVAPEAASQTPTLETVGSSPLALQSRDDAWQPAHSGVKAEAEEKAEEAEVRRADPEDDRKAHPARETMTEAEAPAKAAEPAPQKSLVGMWFDLFLGRKS